MFGIVGGLAIGVSLSLGAPEQFARGGPADGLVLIYVDGFVRSETENLRQKDLVRRSVKTVAGSGFLISRAGHIITSYQVISGTNLELIREGHTIRVDIAVKAIEAVFASGQHADAAVVAMDPTRDLAVLSVGGGKAWPFRRIGDSDILAEGTPVHALGLRLGQTHEIGTASEADSGPWASVSPGTVSLVRTGADGKPEFFQLRASIDPWTRGGPIVSDDGYVVGLLQTDGARTDGIATALTINRVKDYLEQYNFDALPTQRLTLGPVSSLVKNRLRIQMPYGFEDESQTRLHVEAGSRLTTSLKLRIDRVASPQPLELLERWLLESSALEPPGFGTYSATRWGPAVRGRVVGKARRTGVLDGVKASMIYAILDLGGQTDRGSEKIIARYVGPADEVAFNEAVLSTSLATLEADSMLGPRALDPGRWSRYDLPDPVGVGIAFPHGWIVEPGQPFGCSGHVAPVYSVALSPPRDYTQSLRLVWWARDTVANVMAHCFASHEPSRDGTFRRFSSWAGLTYRTDGQFMQLGEDVVLLERVTPVLTQQDMRAAGLPAVLSDWRRALESRVR